jgi:hypothetical protein
MWSNRSRTSRVKASTCRVSAIRCIENYLYGVLVSLLSTRCAPWTRSPPRCSRMVDPRAPLMRERETIRDKVCNSILSRRILRRLMTDKLQVISIDDEEQWNAEHEAGGLPSRTWRYAWALSASGIDPQLAVVRSGGARMLLPSSSANGRARLTSRPFAGCRALRSRRARTLHFALG